MKEKRCENIRLPGVYPARLAPDKKDGGYVVTFRDIPEAITQGDTIAEAQCRVCVLPGTLFPTLHNSVRSLLPHTTPQ